MKLYVHNLKALKSKEITLLNRIKANKGTILTAGEWQQATTPNSFILQMRTLRSQKFM